MWTVRKQLLRVGNLHRSTERGPKDQPSADVDDQSKRRRQAVVRDRIETGGVIVLGLETRSQLPLQLLP